MIKLKIIYKLLLFYVTFPNYCFKNENFCRSSTQRSGWSGTWRRRTSPSPTCALSARSVSLTRRASHATCASCTTASTCPSSRRASSKAARSALSAVASTRGLPSLSTCAPTPVSDLSTATFASRCADTNNHQSLFHYFPPTLVIFTKFLPFFTALYLRWV